MPSEEIPPAVKVKAQTEEDKLVAFFNEPAAYERWGHQGDYEGWSPAETAINAMRAILAARAPRQSSLPADGVVERLRKVAARVAGIARSWDGPDDVDLLADARELREISAALSAQPAPRAEAEPVAWRIWSDVQMAWVVVPDVFGKPSGEGWEPLFAAPPADAGLIQEVLVAALKTAREHVQHTAGGTLLPMIDDALSKAGVR